MARIDRIGLSAIATLVAVMATPSVAQTASAPSPDQASDRSAGAEQRNASPAEEALGQGDIVVTAQKRSERLQDVPVSISALGAVDLEGAGVVNITQIAPRVPGFYGGSAGATRPQLYIRGIGSRQFDAGSEASVGVFVDEVYLGRTAGTLGALRDVERIEVLKGPQGTLYGRNTIGGAINVITKGPTRDLQAEAEVGYGNFDAYNLFGAVSGPVVGDAVQARIAGWRTFSKGYMRNPQTGYYAQGVDNYGGRGRLDIEPAANLKLALIAEVLRDRGSSFSGKNQGTTANPNAVFFAAAGRVPIQTADPYAERTNLDNLLHRDVETYSGKADLDLGSATLTSITAYRHNRALDDRDFDNTSLSVIQQVSDERSKQFTQELRLTSTPGGALSVGGAVDWILGGFFYHDKSDRVDTFNFGPDSVKYVLTGRAQTDVAAQRFKTESWAAFAQATLHLGPTFDVTLGGRYTEDRKSAVSLGTTTAPGIPLVAANFTTSQGGKFTSVDPRVTLQFRPSRDVNVYASYNQGFKSGGFQYVPFSAAQANVVFQPEQLDAYEIGFKTQLMDRKLTFNGALFKYDYKDLQVLRVVATAGGGAATLIQNAASSTIKGGELELVARPSSRFEASLTYAYTDAKYDSFPFNATTDFSNTRMVRAPKHSVNMGARWTVPLGDNSVELRADYALLSDFFFEPGEGKAIYGTTTPLSVQDGYGLLDLRATFRVGNFRIGGYVANATNVYYRRTALALPGQLVGYPGAPRTYGLSIGWSYR
jgi:iron complex outermembrane recepter protein